MILLQIVSHTLKLVSIVYSNETNNGEGIAQTDGKVKIKIEEGWSPIGVERSLFEFKAREGVNIVIENEPYQIFLNFFDSTIVEHIAKQTNIYADQYLTTNVSLARCARAKRWKNTNSKEIYLLLSYMLLQGYICFIFRNSQ